MGKRSIAKHSALPPVAPATERVQRQKDEEELELEERLFGTKKRRIGDVAANAAPKAAHEDEMMDGMDDGDLFMIDAPTMDVDVDGSEAEFESDAEGDVSVDEDEDEIEVAGQERVRRQAAMANESGAEESEIDYEASSAPGSEDDSEEEDDIEFANDSDVDIQLPEDQYDYAEYQKDEAERKAKVAERKCVWHDPADDMIGVDLAEVRRLKKLARGKREGEGQIGGTELASRLREQYVSCMTSHIAGSVLGPAGVSRAGTPQEKAKDADSSEYIPVRHGQTTAFAVASPPSHPCSPRQIRSSTTAAERAAVAHHCRKAPSSCSACAMPTSRTRL